MKKPAVLLATILSALTSFAGRSPGFGIDAFNCAVPDETAQTVVFSPAGFEIDAAIMSDAFDPIVKSHFAETLGVLTGIENTYGAMAEYLRECAPTNGISFKAARAFLVTDFRKVSAPYRQDVERYYRAEVCRLFPKDGAECWFRTMLDGEMEDFALPIETSKAERNSFYEALSCRIGWEEPFPKENMRGDMMCDARVMDLYETDAFTMGRLPMADGAWFYALTPKAGVDFRKVREAVSSKTIRELLTIHNSVTNPGVWRGPVVVAVPRMDVKSSNDLAQAMNHFKFPVKGYLRLNGDLPGRDYRQICRFRLDGCGANGESIIAKSEETQIPVDASTRKFLLTGKFLFFVYHEKTDSILVMGIHNRGK